MRHKYREKFHDVGARSRPNFSQFDQKAGINFKCIFGTRSLGKTIALLIRLQRAKRVSGTGTAKKHWPRVASLESWQDVLPGRRYHHLTGSRRQGMPYEGSGPENLLLLKKSRHAAFHRQFGSRTLEEVIILLLRLHRFGCSLCNFLRSCYSRLCNTQRLRRLRERVSLTLRFQKHLEQFSS